jgi:hypothetical protein
MARQKKRSTFTGNFIKSIFGFIPEIISELIKESMDNFISEINRGMENILKDISLRFYFFMLMIASVVLFSISLVLILEKYLLMKREFSLIVLAVIYVIAMLIIKINLDK